jgi:hypothetical protein
MLQSFDKGKQVDIGILDFSKAFDTVPHDRLLHKIDQYGTRGPLHTWLTSCLTERKMRVALEGEYSDESTIVSRVPHGTVLGPILFLCHINVLSNSVKSSVSLFTDDCLLYREINNENNHTILQNDIKNLEKWASDWGMRFNAKKWYIRSMKEKSHHSYTLNNKSWNKYHQTPT